MTILRKLATAGAATVLLALNLVAAGTLTADEGKNHGRRMVHVTSAWSVVRHIAGAGFRTPLQPATRSLAVASRMRRLPAQIPSWPPELPGDRRLCRISRTAHRRIT